MKANELRINNIYKTNIEFVGSLEAKINVFKDKEYFILNEKKLMLILQFDLLKFIEPIQLTEEWLLKCGFEMNRLSFSIKFELNNFIIFKIDDYFYAKVIGMEINLKYLHELQNLYFTHNKKELNVNL